MRSLVPNLVGGVVGATALIGTHEAVRRFRDDAPRSDLLGKRAIERTMKAAGRKPLKDPALYRASIASGLLSDAAFYALVGPSVLRAGLVGGLLGIGTVVAPRYMGLGRDATSRTPSTVAMTIAWYALGGFVAWASTRALRSAFGVGASEEDSEDAGEPRDLEMPRSIGYAPAD